MSQNTGRRGLRILHAIVPLIGVVLFSYLLYQAGPRDLWGGVVRFGFGLGLFIALEGVGDVMRAMATRYCFSRESPKVPLVNLLYARCTAAAYNFITPTSGFGGEVVKAMLLEKHVPRSEAARVVIIDKFTYSIVQFGLAFLGSAVVLAWTPIDLGVKLTFWAASALMWGGFIGFLIFQRQGRFGDFLGRVVGAVAGRQAREWVETNLSEMDGRLRSHYETQRKELLLAMFWHALGFTTGIAQAGLFLWCVFGVNDWAKASTIWFFGSWFDCVIFMVPAGLGTQELTRALIFERTIGFTFAEGVAFSMILRLNQIFWTAVGLATYWLEMALSRRRLRSVPVRTESDTLL
ncbi:membrane protein [Candidatus Methylomirabilis lanthanidiphila]|uniref:Membrane protein n=1 Tax=Candidatus Methylomirabilis lanthanidiphila TaxID=2211376 RepID=A0A564ZNL3_9BACT|nr:flippase-like domain-containing protein [Candidatus Methylomirabilis lanthanidiphila]VUZ86128.1 membrane protein [Candidatus Methylomirabilis lanthanidiphila]